LSGLDSSDLGYGLITGPYKGVNNPLNSIKVENFFTTWQERLCTIQFII